MQKPATPLPANVIAALERKSPIEAVKLLRQATGLGLSDAMAAIARHAAEKGPLKTTAKTRAATVAGVAPPAARGRKLAPGEVPRTGSGTWWTVLAVAAGAVAYVYFRG